MRKQLQQQARIAFLLLWAAIGSYEIALAQQPLYIKEKSVTAYHAVVKTDDDTYSGILEQATDSNLVLRNNKNGYDYVALRQIRNIRIKYDTKEANYKVQYYAMDEDDYDPDVSYGENLATEVAGNITFNLVGFTGSALVNTFRTLFAGNILNYEIEGDEAAYRHILPELRNYSVYHQLSEEYEQELLEALNKAP